MSTKSLSKRDRMKAVLSGERPDRVPVAFWRHWPVDDQDEEMLAMVTLEYQKKFDMDWIKLTPSSSYCIDDYGAKHHYRGKAIGERDYIERIIKNIEDWDKIEPLNVTKGTYARILRTLEKVIKRRDPETPVVMTVFTASRMAGYMAGDENLTIHMRKDPKRVKRAISALAETCESFVREVMDRGADGIFLSTNAASYDVMNEEEHNEFSRPFDIRILQAAEQGWLNTMHLHGQHPMFNSLCDYPVSIINWHDRAAGPSLQDAMKLFPGTFAAGIEQFHLLHFGSPKEIEEQIADAILQTGGRRLMITPGCTFPLTVPEGNLYTVRRAVEKYRP